MTYYEPDNWVIVKIARPEGTEYKVLGGWNGGYLHGSSWRLNSGIVRAEQRGDYMHFFGNSGSEYRCDKTSQRLSMATGDIFEQLVKQGEDKNIVVEMVDEFPR